MEMHHKVYLECLFTIVVLKHFRYKVREVYG